MFLQSLEGGVVTGWTKTPKKHLPMVLNSFVYRHEVSVDVLYASALVGVDLNQKGMQVPQQFGSASSYGKKYALGNLFLIDDTQDSDASNTHGKAPKAKTKSTITSKKDPAYDKAVQYIAAGGKLEAIKQKYNLSAEVEGALNTL